MTLIKMITQVLFQHSMTRRKTQTDKNSCSASHPERVEGVCPADDVALVRNESGNFGAGLLVVLHQLLKLGHVEA